METFKTLEIFRAIEPSTNDVLRPLVARMPYAAAALLFMFLSFCCLSFASMKLTMSYRQILDVVRCFTQIPLQIRRLFIQKKNTNFEHVAHVISSVKSISKKKGFSLLWGFLIHLMHWNFLLSNVLGASAADHPSRIRVTCVDRGPEVSCCGCSFAGTALLASET